MTERMANAPTRPWFLPVLACLSIVVAVLACVTVWLLVDDIEQGEKLRGVTHVGPCRAIGITDPECQKQARRIFAACYIQRRECREKYGLILVRIGERRPDRSDVAIGGDALQPAQTGQRTGAGGGPGGGEQVGQRRPDRGPRTDRPSRPDAPSVPDQLSPAPAPSLLPPQANGKGTPEPPPQAEGLVRSTVDAVTDLGCAMTQPVTGVCLR